MQTHTNVHAVEPLTGNLNVSPNYFDTSFVSRDKKTKQKTNKTDCCLFFFPSRLIIKGKERILNQHTLQKAGRALDMLPVYHRANTDWQINTHTLPFRSCGKFRSSKPPDCMSVGCGKKSRPLEETHMYRWRIHRMHQWLRIKHGTLELRGQSVTLSLTRCHWFLRVKSPFHLTFFNLDESFFKYNVYPGSTHPVRKGFMARSRVHAYIKAQQFLFALTLRYHSPKYGWFFFSYSLRNERKKGLSCNV